jgi:hypothetical protein
LLLVLLLLLLATLGWSWLLNDFMVKLCGCRGDIGGQVPPVCVMFHLCLPRWRCVPRSVVCTSLFWPWRGRFGVRKLHPIFWAAW